MANIYLSDELAQQVEIHRKAIELMERIKTDDTITQCKELTFEQALNIVISTGVKNSINHLAKICDKLDPNRIQENY